MRANDIRLNEVVARYKASGIEAQIDFSKHYLYSIVTHSTAIEGSTITEVENQLLFEEGISPAGRSVVEQMMNLDLKEAYTLWLSRFANLDEITADTIKEMSASVMRRTGSVYNTMLGEFDSSKGDIRLVNVTAGAGGRSYMGYQKVPAKLDEFCRWLTESIHNIDSNNPAAVYRLSFAAHSRLVTIHPWVDGNGRVSRLLMNLLQARYGLPMSKITPGEKASYIQSLIDAREADDENIFVERAMQRHIEELERQLEIFEADTR